MLCHVYAKQGHAQVAAAARTERPGAYPVATSTQPAPGGSPQREGARIYLIHERSVAVDRIHQNGLGAIRLKRCPDACSQWNTTEGVRHRVDLQCR